MGYIIIVIFVITTLLSLLEDKLPVRQKKKVYVALCAFVIIATGLKDVEGGDPDAANYEYTYQHYDDPKAVDQVDYSFLLLSRFGHLFSSDSFVIFFIYALIGVSLKFYAFRKYSEMWFLPLVVYFSYYYEFHELTQIRAGVMTGCFLLAIKPLAERRLLPAFLLMVCGTFFHVSGLVLLPLLFLNNSDLNLKWRLFWLALIPVGFTIYFVGNSFIINIPIPYVENKLMSYQEAEVTGKSHVAVRAFSIVYLLSIALYVYLMYFYETMREKNQYFPIMMKIFGISLFCYTSFSFLPVLADRFNGIFQVVSVILYTNILYTIKPKWFGIITVAVISFAYLNFTLPYILQFHILF